VWKLELFISQTKLYNVGFVIVYLFLNSCISVMKCFFFYSIIYIYNLYLVLIYIYIYIYIYINTYLFQQIYFDVYFKLSSLYYFMNNYNILWHLLFYCIRWKIFFYVFLLLRLSFTVINSNKFYKLNAKISRVAFWVY
jgi:hypothetical protein